MGLHDLVELNAPVVETAGGGEPDAVLHSVAPDRAHLADAYGDAGAVAVAQAQLDIVPEVLGIDGVFLLDMLTQGTNVLLQDFRFVVFLFHNSGPLSLMTTGTPLENRDPD